MRKIALIEASEREALFRNADKKGVEDQLLFRFTLSFFPKNAGQLVSGLIRNHGVRMGNVQNIVRFREKST